MLALAGVNHVSMVLIYNISVNIAATLLPDSSVYQDLAETLAC